MVISYYDKIYIIRIVKNYTFGIVLINDIVFILFPYTYCVCCLKKKKEKKSPLLRVTHTVANS